MKISAIFTGGGNFVIFSLFSCIFQGKGHQNRGLFSQEKNSSKGAIFHLLNLYWQGGQKVGGWGAEDGIGVGSKNIFNRVATHAYIKNIFNRVASYVSVSILHQRSEKGGSWNKYFSSEFDPLSLKVFVT